MQCPNGQQDKMTSNDLQNFTQKFKVRTTRTSLKSGDELKCPGRVCSSCYTCVTRRVSVTRHQHHLIWTIYVNKHKQHQ